MMLVYEIIGGLVILLLLGLGLAKLVERLSATGSPPSSCKPMRKVSSKPKDDA